MEEIAGNIYIQFDRNRKEFEALDADKQDIVEIEKIVTKRNRK